MSESRIQTSIITWLKKSFPGSIVWKIHEDPVFGVSGIPDIYFAYDYQSLWFEVKTQEGRVSKLQQSRIKQLKENGIKAFVVRSLEEVKEIVCIYGL